MRRVRNHGMAPRYYHSTVGGNFRLDAIQAGILSVKLRHLPAWTESRRKAAGRYNDLLKGLDGIVVPAEGERSKAVYHLYVVRTAERDGLKKYLAERQIDTGLHYPLPLHQQKAYSGLDLGNGGLPVSERAAREILSLPMFPGLTEEQQVRVVDGIRGFLAKSA